MHDSLSKRNMAVLVEFCYMFFKILEAYILILVCIWEVHSKLDVALLTTVIICVSSFTFLVLPPPLPPLIISKLISNTEHFLTTYLPQFLFCAMLLSAKALDRARDDLIYSKAKALAPPCVITVYCSPSFISAENFIIIQCCYYSNMCFCLLFFSPNIVLFFSRALLKNFEVWWKALLDSILDNILHN